jgi:hypothetical protein
VLDGNMTPGGAASGAGNGAADSAGAVAATPDSGA